MRLYLSFGEGPGVRLFVLSKFMFQPQAAEPTGLFVRFARFVFVLKTICRAELGFSLSFVRFVFISKFKH